MDGIFTSSGLFDAVDQSQSDHDIGVRRQAVALWRGRFLDLGIDGIAKDAPRCGRHRTARSPERVRAIIDRPAGCHAVVHHLDAKAAGTSASTVGRILRIASSRCLAHGLPESHAEFTWHPHTNVRVPER